MGGGTSKGVKGVGMFGSTSEPRFLEDAEPFRSVAKLNGLERLGKNI